MTKTNELHNKTRMRRQVRKINPQNQKPRLSLTAQAVKNIRDWLDREKVLPGFFIPSERALSEMLGVSRVTVRRALRILTEDQTLSTVACRGYSLNPLAERKSGELSKAPMLFVHRAQSENTPLAHRHERIWAGVREEAAKVGTLSMISCIAEADLTAECALELARITKTVLCDYTSEKSLHTLLNVGIHLVKVEYYRNSDLRIDAIVQDDVGGTEAAVRHLYARGHRRIGYVDATDLFLSGRRELNMMHRLSGFKTCTRQLSIADGCAILPYAEGETQALTRRFLERGVTALIFPYARSWYEMRPELEQAGIVIPSDFGVVVWQVERSKDDPWPLPDHVSWSREEMGRTAVRRLLIRMKDKQAVPTTIMIPCQIVDGGTGGAGPGDP